MERTLAVNAIGRIADLYIPEFVKRRELRKLFVMTASAFGTRPVSLTGLSYSAMLVEYAHFTRGVIARSVENLHNLGTSRHELCQKAYELGSSIRKRFGVRSIGDVMTACRIVYRALGVDFHGTGDGSITIRKCFFSDYYSEQSCGIISCLDKGLVAGISDGGKLSFTQRITEGCDCCKAEFIPREQVYEVGDRGGYRSGWCNCS
jgi:hypothetical protein